MRIRSIRTRLTLWYTGLLTVTLLVLGSLTYGMLVYSMSQEVDTALRGVANALSEQARREAAVFFPAAVDEIFRRFFGVSPVNRYFQMLDPRGQRDPRAPTSGKIAPSQTALHNATQGLSTFETIEGITNYPVRVLTMPVPLSRYRSTRFRRGAIPRGASARRCSGARRSSSARAATSWRR